MVLDDLAAVKDDMIAFVAGHGMRRMNGYVSEDVPTVIFEADSDDGWKDFVEHAKAAGAPFITMSEVVLEPEDVATLMERSAATTTRIRTHPSFMRLRNSPSTSAKPVTCS
jgi:hypothetical protein